MRTPMLTRIAARNLFRHKWRTILTIGGIAVSTALLIWLLALLTGIYDEMARGTTSLEIGQVQIQSAEYVERASIHHHFAAPPELLDELEDTPGVDAAAPRVILHGLLGHEEQSRITRIKGVDSAREARVTVLERALISGQWLAADPPEETEPRQVVVGSVVARILDVGVGDEIVVIVQAADGSMGNDLLQVTGIVHTGNIEIDRHTAFMHLEDVQFISALEGQVHEIALAADLDQAPSIAEAIQQSFARHGEREFLVIRPWQEIASEIYLMTELAQQLSWWLLFIIFAIAALGTFNTLRMSTLERSREFGVMLGVGLSRGRLMSIIAIEGILLGVIGAILGGIFGAALAYGMGTYGLSVEFFTAEESLTLMGVAFSDRIYFDVPTMAIVAPVVGILVVTALCSLWPAAMAIRLEPRDAIAGR